MKLSLMATILVAFVYATYMLVVWEIPKSAPNIFFGITNINPEKFVFFKLFLLMDQFYPSPGYGIYHHSL